MRTGGWYFRAAAACAASVLLGASSAPQRALLSDPNAIFAATRAFWSAGAFPRYASYAVGVDYRNGAQHMHRTWDTTEDLRHAVVFTRSFNREEIAHPQQKPGGVNIWVPLLGVINPVRPADPVGAVAFAVDQDFGLAPVVRHYNATGDASAFDGARSRLTVIGRTGVAGHDYDVTLLEARVDEQGPEYHLALRPLTDPVHHRLRELWVDGATMAPEEAVVAGIGSRPPLNDVDWRVEFRQVQGATYVATETALAPVDYGRAGLLRDFTVTFDELALSSRMPMRWSFDLSRLKAPQRDP